MDKEIVLNKAKAFSKNPLMQKGYVAGFQACCNLIRKDFSSCYNDEFLEKMEALSEVAYIEFD